MGDIISKLQRSKPRRSDSVDSISLNNNPSRITTYKILLDKNLEHEDTQRIGGTELAISQFVAASEHDVSIVGS